MFAKSIPGVLSVLLLLSLRVTLAWAAQPAPAAPPPQPVPAAAGVPAGPNAVSPLTPLGPGDSVTLHVFGQPDMDTVLGIADDGSIRIPLAGSIQVGGLSAESAARRC